MIREICVLSGGMDSATVAYMLKKQKNKDLVCLTFVYGQKHKKEVDFAKKIACDLNADHLIIDLDFGKHFLSGSSLTSEEAVPEGEYTVENMKSTVVPNRNTIMLSVAWSIACNLKSEFIGCGIHAGDNLVYPDCRPDFLYQFQESLRLATKGIHNEKLIFYMPFMSKDKSECVQIGLELGLDFKNTWTCYNGFEKHCGKCGACFSRKSAFEKAGVKDPTEYLNA